MNHLGRTGAAWGAFALWAAAVWTLSSLPDPAKSLDLTWSVPDKAAHFAEFAVGGFLARAALLRSVRPGPWAAAVVLCSVWAFADEVHQAFVPGRSMDAADLLADVLGASAGAGLHAWIARGRSVRGSQ